MKFFTGILIIIYPVLNVAYVFAPYRIFGKNIYIVFPVLLFVFFNGFIFLGLTKKKTQNYFYALFALAGLTVLLWLLRDLAYGNDRSFLDVRYIFVIFIFTTVFVNLIETPSNSDRFAELILLSSFLQALLGIVHTHFFSNINLAVDENFNLYLAYGFERTRETSLLINANAYSSYLICGLFILTFYRHKNTFFRNGLFVPFIFGVILYAISLSGSRFPMVAGPILGIVLFYRLYWKNGITLSSLVAFSFLVAAFLFLTHGDIETFSIVRVGSGRSDGRLGKLITGLELLLSDFLNFFIGASDNSVVNTITSDGLDISDNSYLHIALSFGIPFAIVWFWTFFKFFKNYLVSLESKITFVYILISLGFYNSILWEIWLFNMLLTFLCIASNCNSSERRSTETYKWRINGESQI